MKKLLQEILILLVVGTMFLATAMPEILNAQPTNEEIQQAIDSGIEWLVNEQNPDGNWGDGWAEVAKTGFAVIKLEDRAFEMGKDPFDEDYEYSANVKAGLNYLFSKAVTVSIYTQPAGDPDSEGDGTAIGIWYDPHIYETGIAMMAIAASRHPEMTVSVPGPINGWTYQKVMQNTVDYLAFGQTDTGSGQGGWGYSANEEFSDNSNSGYAVLGLRYAEDFGCSIPSFVKTELDIWINFIQHNPGDPGYNPIEDGGSGYDEPLSMVNVLKTGNLLFEMAFVGDDTLTSRAVRAIAYIARHWNDPGGCETGWKNPPNYQTMYCLMKGFESMSIDTIIVDSNEVDWFDEMSTVILNNQNPDGSWPGDCWGDEMLATEWALLTLEKIAPPSPEILVPLDIKPTSCPNPLNIKSNGILPVAILGTDSFDVAKIDPDSVLLEGVAPVRWALEDVGTPFEPFADKKDCYDCTDEGPDGYLDLTLKFTRQEIVSVLGDIDDRDCIVLQLTGNLKENFGGTSIVGEDVVIILKKGKEKTKK